jgi:hypothetical protein
MRIFKSTKPNKQPVINVNVSREDRQNYPIAPEAISQIKTKLPNHPVFSGQMEMKTPNNPGF